MSIKSILVSTGIFGKVYRLIQDVKMDKKN